MEAKQQLTTEEKRKQRIAQLKAQLQREEAQLNKSKRKERDGQLIAFGVLVEEIFKTRDEIGRKKLIESAKKHLKDRNLMRALSGFERLAQIADTKIPSSAEPQKTVVSKTEVTQKIAQEPDYSYTFKSFSAPN
jgi:hypothetical protein